MSLEALNRILNMCHWIYIVRDFCIKDSGAGGGGGGNSH